MHSILLKMGIILYLSVGNLSVCMGKGPISPNKKVDKEFALICKEIENSIKSINTYQYVFFYKSREKENQLSVRAFILKARQSPKQIYVYAIAPKNRKGEQFLFKYNKKEIVKFQRRVSDEQIKKFPNKPERGCEKPLINQAVVSNFYIPHIYLLFKNKLKENSSFKKAIFTKGVKVGGNSAIALQIESKNKNDPNSIRIHLLVDKKTKIPRCLSTYQFIKKKDGSMKPALIKQWIISKIQTNLKLKASDFSLR